jgi:two-component system, chemotaxis family, protein-glutamate methylesterase/glutaminase
MSVVNSERPDARASGFRRAGRERIVAMASSTGGPEALQEVLAALPADFAVPILAVQHMAKGYIGGLASALAAKCRMRVKLAEHRERLHRGTIYLAPDDYHLGVAGLHTIELSDAPEVEGFRPSATWLFSTVADYFRAGAIGVVLTGRGLDGVAGLIRIHRAGGLILAQDGSTAVAYEMPRAAVEAGVTDFILPLQEIAGRLKALV